ncbi:MAG: thioredoxin family protein [Kiritimatiellaeota bacterium]|nr:thioredoxin family protein [Kiritimatiellota bacterium]
MNYRGLLLAWLVTLGVTAKASTWETDFAKASTDARKAGSYLLLDFSGSDWCGWCVKLEKEVFSQAEFKAYAKTNLVCVLLDFPRQKFQSKKIKEQNAALAKAYGIRGYPSVIILSPDGEVVGQTGYREGGPKKYVEYLKQLIDKDKLQRPKNPDKKGPAVTPPATGGST